MWRKTFYKLITIQEQEILSSYFIWFKSKIVIVKYQTVAMAMVMARAMVKMIVMNRDLLNREAYIF